MIEIIDGLGSGNRAEVTSEKRLAVDAIVTPHITHEAIDDGSAYILSTGFISLTTTGSFNGLMYIKGLSSSSHFHVQRIRICSNTSGSLQVKVLKNPTAGTLISDANEGYAVNTNLGSANTLTDILTVYTASGDGKTVTDGDWFTQYQQPLLGHSSQEYEGAIMVPKDKSLAILAKPSAACDICVEILGYVELEH